MSESAFVGWAVLELFGHRQLAGFVSETELAGKRMVRVDVPCREGSEETREADHWPAVRLFGPDAIYSCSEAFARKVAERLQPIMVGEFLQLSAPDRDDEEPSDEDPGF